MAPARILIVERDAAGAQTLAQELEAREFLAHGAVYGAAAMEAFQAESHDLVLMHATAGASEWMELLKSVMDYDPEALVVIMAANATVDMAVEALKSGATEFIEGTLPPEDTAARLREILAKRGEKVVQGNLRDLALTSIISVNCNEHNQAQLVIRRQGRVGTIYFDGGTIVHAILDDLEGEAAIYELLSWDDGSFSLRQDTPPPKRTIGTDWTGLLLEGMRRIDDGLEQWELDELEEVAIEEEETGIDQLAGALKAVRGVVGLVMCSPGGEVVGEEASSASVRRALMTALVGQRSRRLAYVLDVGEPTRAFIAGAGSRFLVLPSGEDYVGAWISQRSLPESVATEIKTVLRRYRQVRGGWQ
jgi:ActR/RegA family two-component response regulator